MSDEEIPEDMVIGMLLQGIRFRTWLEKRVESKIGFRIRQRITIPRDIVILLNKINLMKIEWTENINKSIIHKKICHYIQSYLSDTIRMHGLKDSNAFHSFTHVLVNPFDISKCKSNVPAEALDEWHDATFGFGEANISGEPEYGV
tara:strand:+ start:1331 stop:1768 length:438 start_codon:yes stop_codon:yes gene_type:complete